MVRRKPLPSAHFVTLITPRCAHKDAPDSRMDYPGLIDQASARPFFRFACSSA
jgi:hypothetical protein